MYAFNLSQYFKCQFKSFVLSGIFLFSKIILKRNEPATDTRDMIKSIAHDFGIVDNPQ